jgi:hypothetical protein
MILIVDRDEKIKEVYSSSPRYFDIIRTKRFYIPLISKYHLSINFILIKLVQLIYKYAR